MEQSLKQFLEENGYFNIRTLSDGRIIANLKFVFTTAIVVGIDESGYYGRYCYGDHNEPVDIIHNWDGIGDPPGNWIKYKGYPEERLNPNFCNGD